MKNALLVVPLLSAGLLAAGCAASSTSSGGSGAAAGSRARARPPARVGRVEHGGVGHRGKPDRLEHGGGLRYLRDDDDLVRAPACTSADLTASLGGGAGAGMSQNHTGLQLRNTGSAACTLYGYPGVSWVRGASGIQTGAAAVRRRTRAAPRRR